MVTLEEIVLHKRKELDEMKAGLPQKQLLAGIQHAKFLPRGFQKVITNGKGIRIIAEIKKASPSEGIICDDFNVAKIAECYEGSGAAAISVLTESKYFLGRSSHISMARQQVSIPVLRKDFLIDRYQILESAALGCDAALLIVAILDNKQLADFIAELEQYKIDPLVEVHTEEELERALKAKAKIIGINNRNLKTMEIDMGISVRLLKQMPADVAVVAESGFETHDQIKHLADLGVKAFLIGTSILKSEDKEKKIKSLRGIPS